MTAGHDYHAARATGQQRTHLGFVAGIVQHDQHPPARQQTAVQPLPAQAIRRDLAGGDLQRLQEDTGRVRRLDRLLRRVKPAQIHIELPVREPAGSLMGPVQGERGLADPSCPAHHGDSWRGGMPARLAEDGP